MALVFFVAVVVVILFVVALVVVMSIMATLTEHVKFNPGR